MNEITNNLYIEIENNETKIVRYQTIGCYNPILDYEDFLDYMYDCVDKYLQKQEDKINNIAEGILEKNQ